MTEAGGGDTGHGGAAAEVRPEAPPSRARLLVTYGLAGVILGGAALAWPLNPDWNNPYYIGQFTLLAVTLLLVAGLNLLTGQSGQVSLGHGALFAAGAYCSAILTVRSGWPFPLAFLGSAALGSGLGLLLGVPALRLRGAYLALVTLAFGGIVALLVLGGGRLTGGLGGLRDIPAATFGSVTLEDLPYYYFALAIALLGLFLARNLTLSRAGRALQAVRDSELGAEACGIDVSRYKIGAFAVASGYAGAAGSLFAHSSIAGSRFIDPSSFYLIDDPAKYSFLLLATLIIGGLGTVVGGALLGSILLFLANTSLSDLASWETTGLGVVLVLGLVFLPEGVVGRFRRSRASALLPPLRQRRLMLLPETAAGAPPRVRARGLPAAAETRSSAGLLRVTGLQRRFGGVVAVDDLGLEVTRGSVHALIGPNGSGKTTVFNILSGFVRADAGAARFAGHDLLRLRAWQRPELGICRTFQNLQLFPRLPALTNVAIGAHQLQRPRLLGAGLTLPAARADESRVMEEAYEVMRLLRIEHLYRQPAGELSYGQQKMLELARALAGQPVLLMLDEPTTGISQAWVENIVEAITAARDAGITVLLIEHRMDVVAQLADRVTVLDYGRKIAEGPLDQVRDHPRVVAAYLGEPEEAGG